VRPRLVDHRGGGALDRAKVDDALARLARLRAAVGAPARL
jgi:hypothetical protein